MLYKSRCVRSPEDSYKLFKQFLGEADREYFVVKALDTKNQPTTINVCHMGESKRHPREVMILSNTASLLCFHKHPSSYLAYDR